MTTYHFDEILDRSKERSKTWDFRTLRPGELPMNGAETHFTCPYPVLDAVRAISECQIYGYPYFTDDFSNAAAGWYQRRHGWNANSKWVEFVGGIVPGIAFAIQAMTKPGDKVLINTPAYDPFRSVITSNERVIAESPLHIDGNTVSFDWEDMEKQFSDPMLTTFILCDPHNPTGKNCTVEELKIIEALSKQYNVFVIIDEVHADFIFDGKKHTCYSAVGEFAQSFSAVTMNPSKTFNTAGFRTGAIIVPNDDIRAKINVKIGAVKGISRTITGVAAFEACYGGDCDDYADQLKTYIEESRNIMYDFFCKRIPKIKMINPEACFVCWLDCKGLGFQTQDQLMQFFKNAKVLMGNGLEFDKHGLGEGFVRIAYGFPRTQLIEALERIEKAVNAL